MPRFKKNGNFPTTSTPMTEGQKKGGKRKSKRKPLRKLFTSTLDPPIQQIIPSRSKLEGSSKSSNQSVKNEIKFEKFKKPATNSLATSIKSEDDSTDNEDDCIIIDKKPDIIVIEDETTLEDGEIRPGDETKESSNETQCPEKPNISNIEPNITGTLSNFYEDVTPSFGDLSIIPNDVTVTNVPLYESISSSDGGLTNDTTIKLNKSSDPVTDLLEIIDVPVPPLGWDDSVVFISEEIHLDKFHPQVHGIRKPIDNILRENFIPLDDGTNNQNFALPNKRTRNNTNGNQPPFKKFRDFNNTPNLPRPSGSTTLNSAEKKLAQQYNTNTYNPNKEKGLKPGKRMVIIDGSNVAFAHSCDRNFSVEGIKICLEYFDKMGHEVKAVVPRHRLKKSQSTKPEILDTLHREGKIVFTPSKNLPGKSTCSYDDRFILQLASEFDAVIVSNDNYRDLIDENPEFKKIIENRVIGYTWCNDMFLLPKDPYGRLGPTLTVILNRT